MCSHFWLLTIIFGKEPTVSSSNTVAQNVLRIEHKDPWRNNINSFSIFLRKEKLKPSGGPTRNTHALHVYFSSLGFSLFYPSVSTPHFLPFFAVCVCKCVWFRINVTSVCSFISHEEQQPRQGSEDITKYGGRRGVTRNCEAVGARTAGNN